MPLNRRTLAAAALFPVLALAAGCGDDQSPERPDQNSSTGTGSAVSLPAPVGDVSEFLSGLVAVGGCSDALVTGVDVSLAAINAYGVNGQDQPVHGTAKVVAQQGSTSDGVPTCEFTIDPGNTDIPRTLIIGGLPAAQNVLLSATPTPTMADMYGETSEAAPSSCTSVGLDKVAARAEAVLLTTDVTPDCVTENGSHSEIYDIDTREVSITGAGGYAKSANGYFAAAVDIDAVRTGLTSDLSGVFAGWIQRGTDKGTVQDYTLIIG